MASSKSACGSSDQGHRPTPPKESENVGSPPSNTLWVGYLASGTSDADVLAAFTKFGALDCTTMQGSRGYSFVYFRLVEEAKAAKDALHGFTIRGRTIRVEFARPPKASKQIWIGGLCSSVTKQQLEDEFSTFGKIEDYKFLRERNSAIIEYQTLEDAIAAHKSMNGKQLAEEQLLVDFVRYQPPRRDMLDRRDPKSTHWTLEPLEHSVALDNSKNFLSSSFFGSKRDTYYGGCGDGHPSNILLIRYPPPVQIDEQMLHYAMILFGEMERIMCFPSRHCSLVEFRSIDEARRAKEGLQGRLFNDTRIQILFSSRNSVTNKDNAPPFLGIGTRIPEILPDEKPLGSSDLLGPGHQMTLSNFPGLRKRNLSGPNLFMRPLGPRGLDALHAGFDLHDVGSIIQNLPDGHAAKTMPLNWGRQSPSVSDILPSPTAKFQAFHPMPDGWDGLDSRDTKRPRVIASPINDCFLRVKRADDSTIEEHPFPFSHSYQGVSIRSQLDARSSDKDYCWRGVIAKGGAHVCFARCIPIGNGIDLLLSDIINCSARTSLDMLAEHYAEAVGFEIVFFLPDSEEDFASYTDFLRYLSLGNRAGVAKLEDGTTIFLVPPSDFLTKVLNVSGPERLYGVVLNMPQHSTTTVVQPPQPTLPSTLSHHADQQEASNLQTTYNFISQHEDHGLQFDYSQSQQEAPHQAATEKILLPHDDECLPSQSAALDQKNNVATTSKVSLTPDLIATLTSLIPRNIQSSSTSAGQVMSSSSLRPSSHASLTHGTTVAFQASGLEYQPTMMHQTPPPSLGQDFSSQTFAGSQFQAHTNISGRTKHILQPLMSGNGTQIQLPAAKMSQSNIISTRPSTSYSVSQGGHFSAHQSNQIYQFETPTVSHENYKNLQSPIVADASSSALQQQQRFGSSAPGPMYNMSQPQSQLTLSLPIDRGNLELPTQEQQLQNVLSSGQGTSRSDTDKNQQYQSTLQFAANLLFQIQQEQQANARTLGSGSQH